MRLTSANLSGHSPDAWQRVPSQTEQTGFSPDDGISLKSLFDEWRSSPTAEDSSGPRPAAGRGQDDGTLGPFPSLSLEDSSEDTWESGLLSSHDDGDGILSPSTLGLAASWPTSRQLERLAPILVLPKQPAAPAGSLLRAGAAEPHGPASEQQARLPGLALPVYVGAEHWCGALQPDADSQDECQFLQQFRPARSGVPEQPMVAQLLLQPMTRAGSTPAAFDDTDLLPHGQLPSNHRRTSEAGATALAEHHLLQDSLKSRFHAAEDEDDLSSGMCLTAELAAELAAELHADEAPLPADLAAALHEREELLEPAGSGVDGCSFFVLTGPQGKVGGLSDLVEPGHTLDGQSIESTHLDGLKWQPGLQQQVSGARSVRWHARNLQGSQTDDETLERAPLSEEDAAQLAAAALQHFKDASGKLDPDAALQFLLDSSCRGIDLGMSENDWKDLECDVRG